MQHSILNKNPSSIYENLEFLLMNWEAKQCMFFVFFGRLSPLHDSSEQGRRNYAQVGGGQYPIQGRRHEVLTMGGGFSCVKLCQSLPPNSNFSSDLSPLFRKY